MTDHNETGNSTAFNDDGSLGPRRGDVRESPGEPEIQAWLILKLSEKLNVNAEDVDIRKPFTSYGMSSRDAVELSGEMVDWLGRSLSPTLIYEYPSIEALSGYLATELDLPKPGSAVINHLQAETEPVAIIGIGCRFPGAKDQQEFWNLLRHGKDAVTEIPKTRRNLRSYSGTDMRWGGFLPQVDEFDAQFFGISPREAMRMDPQQRLLLEVTWEALEDAGQVAEGLSGSQTGVFIGISGNDYYQLQLRNSGFDDPYVGTGNALSIAANRLSYFFGLRGPSISLDTACSSSLVAVHLACHSLCTGESTLALAGGVNIILSPAITIGFTKAGFLSPDGRCKAFDARANGYVRGEGAGVVVLKLLSQAIADGDPIYALICGSAVNQDGRTNGLTAPSREAQEDVLRRAYRSAAISPGEIQYVEAHGTGTALGDPIEAKALGAALRTGRASGSRCAIGSVKTNIGHLEAAAGIAGLIKVALSLKHRLIPPSLHFNEPNFYIPFETLPLDVQQSLGPWPNSAGKLRAGVSSFGFGGTNGHVVLEEAPALGVDRIHESDLSADRVRLLPLSARSAEGLQACCRAYSDFLAHERNGSDLSLADICYTAAARRSHHDYRLALVGHSRPEFIEQLEGFLRGDLSPSRSSGRRIPGLEHKLAFIFSGQGTQWLGMSRELFEQEPVFRETIEQCAEHLREYAEWDLLEELTAPEAASRLDQTEIAQPVICAIEVALAALWRSWGIVPGVVVGHSLGEIAAAHVAGVFSLKDTMKLVFHRSRLMQRATHQGKMAALGLSLEECEQELKGYEGRLNIAAINSPASTVISGAPDALEAIFGSLKERNVYYQLLNANYAFHSYQMDPLQDELVKALREIRPEVASIPIFSTVTGRISDGEDLDAAYWSRGIREPVRFATAINGLLSKGYGVFLEISPNPVLSPMISQCLDHSGKQGTVLASIRKGSEERVSLLASAGSLYAMGFQLDWNKISGPGRCVPLPGYTWQRERHWLDLEGPDLASAADGQQSRRGPVAMQERPLLGRKSKDMAHFPGTHTWETEINQRSLPCFNEHVVQGAAVLPVTAYIEMALEAAAELFGASNCAVTELEFQKVLFLPERGSRRVQVALGPLGADQMTLHIYSRPADEKESATEWLLHATGKINRQEKSTAKLPVKNTTSKPIDFAVMFFAGSENVGRTDKYRLVIEASRFADQHGFSSVSVPERHFTDFGSLYPNPAVLHAALARETSRVRLRAGSVVAPLHDPIRIAEEWAMVDNLSGGRIELSFASGWHPNDFVFFPEKYAHRHEEMFRAITTIQKLWRGESIQARSGNGESIEVNIYPRPLQTNVPIWITAAGNPQTFARAGELGANLLTHLLDQDFATLAQRISIYRQARAQHGHDSHPGRVSVMLHTFIGENIDVVREQVREPYKNYLKSISHLLKSLAYSRGRDIDLAPLSEAERDEFANLLFERFFSKRALLGTAESCFDLVEQLKLIGVDEVSCLLDFGLPDDLSLNNLPYLDQLREMCSPQGDPRVFVQVQQRPDEILARLDEEINVAKFYERLRGVEDNPSFRAIEQLWRGDNEALGKVRLPDFERADGDSYQIHPAVLSACFQVLWATLAGNADSTNDDALYLPTGLRRLILHSRPTPGKSLWSHVVRQSGPHQAVPALEGNIRIIDDDGLLLAEAIGVKFQRQIETISPEADEGFGNLLYELEWQPKNSPSFDDSELNEKGSWIIFLDEGGVGEQFALLLESRAQTCFRIRSGAIYSAAGGQYSAIPGNRQDLDQLMKKILAQESAPLRGVIHLWSLDTICSQDMDVFSLDNAQTLASVSVLQLIHKLAESGRSKPPRLWLVTRGAQAVSSGLATVAIAQSAVWGLGRTCAIEHPEFWGGLIDLDPQASDHDNAAQLLDGLCGQQSEDQLAFRQQQLYVARLVRKESLPRRQTTLRPDASYLITGGLDGLGFEVARWLAEQGAKQLILLGRTNLPPRESWAQLENGRLARHVARIGELERLGAQVKYAAVDVANEEQMSSLSDSLRSENHPPIMGIVHAASVWEDDRGQSLVRTLTLLDEAALQAVFQPKVTGSWLLHKFFGNVDLDFFVLFSSAASLLGSAGQGNYAAAGAFLDAFAYYLRGLGQKAFSISWGPVGETGFGASSEGLKVHEFWEARGIQRITPNQTLEAMSMIVSQDISHLAVAKLDWKLLQKSFTQMAGFPWAANVMAEGAFESSNESSRQNGGQLRQKLFATAPDERQHLLESHFGEQMALALRLPGSRLDIHQPITNFGFDSLMAIEFRNRIQTDLGVILPIVHLLQGASVAQIVTILLDQVLAVDSTVPAPVFRRHLLEESIQADREQLLATLDQLSDERMDELLKETLASDGSDQISDSAKSIDNLSPPERRLLLADLLSKRGNSFYSYPLSKGQHASWFVDQIAPNSPIYNNANAIRLKGPLDVPILERTFQILTDRHSTLRSTFVIHDGKPVQRVHKQVTVCFEQVDASNCSWQDLYGRIMAEASRPFDLERGPVLRVRLYAESPDQHVLLINLHHIVMDFWSMSVLTQEMITIYLAENAGMHASLMPLEEQYDDYVDWQAQLLESAEGDRLRSYWLQQLAGDLPVLNLPGDRPRPAIQTDEGGTYTCRINEELTSALKAIAQAEGTTLFAVMLAAFQVLLYRYSGQNGIIVGSPVTGRSLPAFEPIVGYFVNTVALRADFSRDLTFKDFLSQVRNTVLDALKHQDYPFPVLVEQLRPVRDLSYPPIFQVMFNLLQQRRFQEASASQLFLGGTEVRQFVAELELEWLSIEQPISLFDVLLTALEWEGALTLKWQYSSDIFGAETIAKMAAHFQTLLEGIIATPELPISHLPVLAKSEREQLLLEWNNSQADFPGDLSVTQLFEAQVERTPDAAAAVMKEELVSYAQLNRQANRLARTLVAQGVGPEVMVAILADRGIELLTAMLAVFKAGGAYIPLDPLYPARRLAQMLDQSGVGLILTTSELTGFVSEVLSDLTSERRPLVLSIDDLLRQEQIEANLPCRHTPDNLAYVIYTSGSTGIPKGVMVQHLGMLNHLYAKIAALELTGVDRVAQTASQSFDIAVWQFFAVLLVGGSVHILNNEAAYDPLMLLNRIEREAITIFETVPSLLRAMLESIATAEAGHAALTKLRWLISTGESLPPELCHWITSYPNVRLLNAYGPTECSDDVTHYQVEHSPPQTVVRIPIGRPVANMQLYVLDEQLQPQPIGVAGELFIGGIGVGRGYLNDPIRTAESFVPDPFTTNGGRLYKSGDLARYLRDANIEFLGRVDHQVKVHGLRIELQEIEVALGQHESISESVVLAGDDIPENNHLIAYLVAAADRQPTVQELRSFLKERLPAYMIPSGFVFLESLPRTSSGKLDRRALPTAEAIRSSLPNEYVAPRTDEEQQLATIWAEMLNVERVGVHDNFFECGGHSVLAIHLVARVRQAFGVDLSLLTLFAEPTVAGLAGAIETIKQGAENASPGVTISELRADAVLNHEIAPGVIPEFQAQPANLFMTGATGFLGAYLLGELLEQTDAQIYCLVRAVNVAEGKQRIKETLQLYSLWLEEMDERIVPIVGDLSRPLLGLSLPEFQSLASAIDVIYHNGAAVNFVFPYSALRAANVLGTQEVLRLACQNKVKPVNYISSLAVFPLNSESGDRIILEGDCPESPEELRGGYALSKWVAEQLVLTARRRGLPVSIFRPGLISGHSQTGISNPSDFLCKMIKGCIELGSVPDVDTEVEMTPVDYVSRAIIYLSRKQELQGHVFHLANPRPAHWRELVDSVIAARYKLQRVSYDEWQRRLLALGGRFAENTLFPFLPFFSGGISGLGVYSGNELSRLRMPDYDCRNTLAGLKDSRITCPPIDSKLFGTYLSYFVESGFLFASGAERSDASPTTNPR